MKKYVVITCANKKIGNFVTSHWLRSLKENVNLKNIDIVVIDYGLTKEQKNRLFKKDVVVYQGTKEYHIVNKRFFDSVKILSENNYNQVLFIDGGDIIFQDDISHLFNKDRKYIRACHIGKNIFFYKWMLMGLFDSTAKEKLWKILKNKHILNAGVIFAPTDKFVKMARLMATLIKNKDLFGPDQLAFNYFAYKDRVKILKNIYNFMPSTTENEFFIKEGVFYTKDLKKIPIVHNSGQIDLTRSIKNFGYGKSFNQIKSLIYNLKKTQYSILRFYKEIKLQSKTPPF
ncbi:hypothetical protein H3C65_03720 [Patescibacteria group bacterium]|nr:hypothetical protein [Patescibacteria group bacterium]